jgi:hypothetical protein
MEIELQQVVTSLCIEDVNTGRDCGESLCILLLFAPDACPGILTTWAQEMNGVV